MSAVTRVEVTAEDIAQGERGSWLACPIALAIRRCVPCEKVDVDGGGPITPRWYADINGTRHWLPAEAAAFAKRFDKEGPGAVEPFAFDLPAAS